MSEKFRRRKTSCGRAMLLLHAPGPVVGGGSSCLRSRLGQSKAKTGHFIPSTSPRQDVRHDRPLPTTSQVRAEATLHTHSLPPPTAFLLCHNGCCTTYTSTVCLPLWEYTYCTTLQGPQAPNACLLHAYYLSTILQQESCHTSTIGKSALKIMPHQVKKAYQELGSTCFIASLNFARRGSLLAAAPLLGAAAPFLLAIAAVQERWRETPASVLEAAGLCAEACTGTTHGGPRSRCTEGNGKMSVSA